MRELKSVMQRAVLMNDGEELEAEHLPADLIARALDVIPDSAAGPDANIPTLEEMELRYIRNIYALCGGNKVRAAERLGITKQTLARKLGEAE